jgi:heat shock protein HslJ
MPVPPATDPRQQPSLTFESDTGQFSAAGGCSRLIGSYLATGMSLSMTNGGAIVACQSGVDPGKAFAAALTNTRTYRIAGRTLEFYDGAGKPIARFEAK